jgi:threonine dehydratase
VAVTLADIEAAARTLDGAVLRTPCLKSRTLSEIAGCEIWVKFENLQFTGSFKERGALVKLSSLGAAERRAGVIAMSAGNHAQGVAYHAGRLGIPATIVMPAITPFVKVRDTRAHGARVLLQGETLAEAAAFANALAGREGLTFVHPYDDDQVIAGQGTIALEMLADAPALDTLVVPVGGGGLITGIAIAAKGLRPGIRIVGVESELYAALYQSLHGQPIRVGGATIAEGIAVRDIGTRTLAAARTLLDDVLVAPESEIERAVVLLCEIEKTVAEGAGAAGLAAVLAHPEGFRGRRVGLVLTGGNIDSRLLSSILMRGLVRDGRLVRLRVDIPDAPGSLARVTGLVGATGGNIVEVYHQRLFGVLSAKAAELVLVVETRDRAHIDEMLATLSQAGYRALLLDSSSQPPSTPQ